jgi:hypothetical protein
MEYQECQVFQEKQDFKASMVYLVPLAQSGQQVKQVGNIPTRTHTQYLLKYLNI